MQEKNELNDIILNRDGATSSNKKIILAVATLGIILIIVVLLMNTLTSSGTDNLPQAVLPPEPKAKTVVQTQDEPLFEEVEVIEEESANNNNLDQIAQRLKEESQAEVAVVQESKPVQKEAPKKVVTKKKAVPVVKTTSTKSYYVQVGSFSKYTPNKKFLQSITDKGFTYKYHKVTKNSKTLNKVLVGPFNNEKNARSALRTIRSSIEAGAFLVRI
ncbi:MAG: SPOR domain-containing protein [Campylobacterota bacterium]|nr:SPOR domain-containing protein [Campylobacterota bacterium]